MADAQDKRSVRRPDNALAFDLADRKILSALRADGRLAVNKLGARVGLSQSACWARLKRPEANGTIKCYAAILDHNAVGLANTVFVEHTLNKHDDKVLEQFGSPTGA